MPVSSLHFIVGTLWGLVGSGWLTSLGWPRNDTRSDPNPPAASVNLSSHVGTALAFDRPVRGFSEAEDPGEWLTCPLAGPCTCPCSSMPLVSEISGEGTVVVNLNLTAKCEPEHSLPDAVVGPVATELSALAKFKRRMRVWCSAITASLVWMLRVLIRVLMVGGTHGCIMSMVCGEFFREGRNANFAATFTAALTALAHTTILDTSLAAAFPASLTAASLAFLGTLPVVAFDTATLAPQTVWPPALHVESIPLSAPVPRAFICPITMAPMANPAMTPRGTSYEREALCDWISRQHRYPGGEARAAHQRTHPLTHSAPTDAAHSPATHTGPWDA